MKKLHIIFFVALGVVGLATTFQDSGNLFTFKGPVVTTSSTTNGPADNELATAGWVRNLLVTGQILYNSGDTNASGFDNPTFAYVSTIPTNGSRTYLSAVCTNGAYIGSVMTTNTYLAIGGDFVVSPYMCSINGNSASGYSLHTEIYYTYDKTNLLGDWESGVETIAHGVTNKYSFVVPVPQTTSTNSTGFYIVRRIKINSKTGSGDDIMLHYGTNFPSSISIPGQAAAGANWVASGTTDSTLNGSAFVNTKVVTPRVTQLWGSPQNSGTNIVVDFASLYQKQWIDLANDGYFTGSNLVSGASIILRITSGTTNRNLTYDTSYFTTTNWIGAPSLSFLASNHIAILTFDCITNSPTTIDVYASPSIP